TAIRAYDRGVLRRLHRRQHRASRTWRLAAPKQGDEMDDHFWPSIYPGIIVGALVGLTYGGIVSALAGAAGGTAGAAAIHLFTAWLGLEDSIVSLAALIAGAMVGGYIFMGLASRLVRR
ncbi:MAG TPA: hypothetical protein VIG52_10475, partial [Methyloceanibacter sp.]